MSAKAATLPVALPQSCGPVLDFRQSQCACLRKSSRALSPGRWPKQQAATRLPDLHRLREPGEIGADTLCVFEQDRLATQENAKATQANKLAHQREQTL